MRSGRGDDGAGARPRAGRPENMRSLDRAPDTKIAKWDNSWAIRLLANHRRDIDLEEEGDDIVLKPDEVGLAVVRRQPRTSNGTLEDCHV